MSSNSERKEQPENITHLNMIGTGINLFFSAMGGALERSIPNIMPEELEDMKRHIELLRAAGSPPENGAEILDLLAERIKIMEMIRDNNARAEVLMVNDLSTRSGGILL